MTAKTTSRARQALLVPGGIEYRKHMLWRKANGFLDEQGYWILHRALGASPNSPMPARQWDTLHVILSLVGSTWS